nr:MAG TPA: hypothetical protein [Bacteriophage sp.]
MQIRLNSKYFSFSLFYYLFLGYCLLLFLAVFSCNSFFDTSFLKNEAIKSSAMFRTYEKSL